MLVLAPGAVAFVGKVEFAPGDGEVHRIRPGALLIINLTKYYQLVVDLVSYGQWRDAEVARDHVEGGVFVVCLEGRQRTAYSLGRGKQLGCEGTRDPVIAGVGGGQEEDLPMRPEKRPAECLRAAERLIVATRHRSARELRWITQREPAPVVPDSGKAL